MRRSQADSSNRSLAALEKLQHIRLDEFIERDRDRALFDLAPQAHRH